MSNDILPSNSSINSSYENYQESDNTLGKLESMSSQSKGLSHKFIKEFFKLNNTNFEGLEESNFPKLGELATKVQTLSDEKIKYYQTSKFGFISEFFSKLRNLITLRQFISSGKLGKQLAEQTLTKINKNNSISSYSFSQQETAITSMDAAPVTKANNVVEHEDFLANSNLFEESITTINKIDADEVDNNDNNIEKDDDDDISYYETLNTLSEESINYMNNSTQSLSNLNDDKSITQDDKSITQYDTNSLSVLETDSSKIDSDNDIEDESDEDNFYDATDNSFDEIINANTLAKDNNDALDDSYNKINKPANTQTTTENTPIEDDKNKANIAEVNPTVESDISPTKLDYQIEMLHTFSNIWKNASNDQQGRIQIMGTAVFGKVPIEKWEKIDENKNIFQLTLEKEMIGEENSEKKKIMMKKSIIIYFAEEKKANSADYIQKIIFPQGGLSSEVKTGLWYPTTVNANIDSITFDGDQVIVKGSHNTIPLPDSFTQITLNFEEAIKTWQNVTWK